MMTLSRMLTLNPTRPVLFLVDKVLLVLQQARYIITELGGDREFYRYVSHDLPFVHLTDFCSGMAASTFRFYICIEHYSVVSCITCTYPLLVLLLVYLVFGVPFWRFGA